MKYAKKITSFVVVLAWTGVLGCTEELNCAISGDNVSGRMVYNSEISVAAGDRMYIQTSTDSFSTVRTQNIVSNAQGLASVPYTICAPEDTNLVLRAFVDRDNDGSLGAGDPSGRFDGTSNGHATFTSFLIPDLSNETSKVGGIDVAIDTP